MIRKIIGENVSIGLISEESIMITINGSDTAMNVDDMNELREMTNRFWDANNLWRFTKEEKEDRARHERERKEFDLRCNTGLAQASIRG